MKYLLNYLQRKKLVSASLGTGTTFHRAMFLRPHYYIKTAMGIIWVYINTRNAHDYIDTRNVQSMLESIFETIFFKM